MVDKIDHQESAYEKVVPNLKQPNFLALVDILAAKVQEIEDANFEIIDKTSISTSTGIQLDRLGEVLGVEREGRGDELYRTAIRNAVFEKAKHGGINDLIAVARIQIPQAVTVKIDEYYPNTVLIFVEVIDQTSVASRDLINAAIQQAKQAGIEVNIAISTSGQSFRFSGLTNQFNTGRGFASSATGSGQGVFSTVLQ